MVPRSPMPAGGCMGADVASAPTVLMPPRHSWGPFNLTPQVLWSSSFACSCNLLVLMFYEIVGIIEPRWVLTSTAPLPPNSPCGDPEPH